MKQVRYRTEAFSGLQERNAAEVMAYETFEMGNTDILETLVSGIFAGRSHNMVERCLQIIDELNRNGYVDDMPFSEKNCFFEDVLSEIERSTGVRVQYALWLADKEVVTDRQWYGRDMADDLDFDSYEVGPVVLSELGFDGTLYGYPEMPVSLEAQIEDLQDELCNIINERENDNLDYRRALWLDERYAEVDIRIQEIKEVLQDKASPAMAQSSAEREQSDTLIPQQQCKCKACGTIIDLEDEESLWGHLQLTHEELFDECQDWDTPFMIEEHYDVINSENIRMDLREFLYVFDFDYDIVSPDGEYENRVRKTLVEDGALDPSDIDKDLICLIDKQGAYLGGIGNERYPLAQESVAKIIERMDISVRDYVIEEFESALWDREVDSSCLDLSEMIAKCKELGVGTDEVSYEYAEAIVNPSLIYIEELQQAEKVSSLDEKIRAATACSLEPRGPENALDVRTVLDR